MHKFCWKLSFEKWRFLKSRSRFPDDKKCIDKEKDVGQMVHSMAKPDWNCVRKSTPNQG